MLINRLKYSLLLALTVGIILMVLTTHWLNPLSVQINSFAKNSNSMQKEFRGKIHEQNQSVRASVGIDTRTDKTEQTGNETRKNRVKRCTVLKLKNRLRPGIEQEINCKRKSSLTKDCSSSEFRNPYSIDIHGACMKSTSRDFCVITGFPSRWSVRCNISFCNEKIYLGINNKGVLAWKEFRTSQHLQISIADLIESSSTRYCFIACNKVLGHDNEPQILNLPPHRQRSIDGVNHKRRRKYINFNFIMLDSVSRTHFYRSLPRSVKALDIIAGRGENTMILDFELVQGIRSRTFETLQALFSGYVNPFEVPFKVNELSKEKLNIAKLFSPLKELNFSSLWLEDMCPFSSWGLSRDLLVLNNNLSRHSFYMKFLDACRKAGIDDIGTTFASCSILRHNRVFTPFTSKKICFNGKHHHTYLFTYLKTFQKTMRYRHKPFISFLVSNIAHELFGERVMLLDKDLSQYLKYSSSMSNTLTIVFSDHGNGYNNHKNFDGRLEMFNPFLFMVIPKAVQAIFTADQLRSLISNQNRLISILDLHYTILHVIKLLHIENDFKTDLDNDVSDFNKVFNVSKYGLLTEISAQRSCSLIPRIMPNLCICEGYDVTSENPSYNFILAVYVVDTINDNIRKQLSKSFEPADRSSASYQGGFRNCKRMKLQKIGNVKEHIKNETSKTITMDLYVETDGQIVEEMFFVTLVDTNSSISMIKFDRMTPYAKYSWCCDKDVEVNLCICGSDNDNIENKVFNTEIMLKSILYPTLQHNITSIRVRDNVCLYVIEQFNDNGVVYEVYNDCNSSLTLRLFFTSLHIKLSTGGKSYVKMYPGDIKFIAAGVSTEKWSCYVSVQIELR